MKKISALIFLIFIFASPVLADYNSAYTDYTFNSQKYRSSYNEYQIAKSTYSTYKTLTSKVDAVKKLKTVLQNRNKLMSSYYDLLQEKLLATPGIPDDSKNTFFKMKESEKVWMAEHETKIDAAGSLEDLDLASTDFEGRYSQMASETKQAVNMVLLAKESALSSRWDILANDVSNKLREISATGENTALSERDVVSARNKKELAGAKISAALKADLFETQQRLTEANQYLREGLNYLSEIIKNITG